MKLPDEDQAVWIQLRDAEPLGEWHAIFSDGLFRVSDPALPGYHYPPDEVRSWRPAVTRLAGGAAGGIEGSTGPLNPPLPRARR